ERVDRLRGTRRRKIMSRAFSHHSRVGGLLLALVAAAAPVLRAQAAPDADRAAALAVVRRLFDGMRAGDSAMVRGVVHPKAQRSSAGVRDGKYVVQVDSIGGFLRGVGAPHTYVWDERTRNEVVHLDGPLAVVWAEYTFYAGDKLSHCGVDAFQIARTDAGW